MSEIYDDILDTAFLMDEQLGTHRLPSSAGVQKEVEVNGKKYVICMTIEEKEEEE